MEIAARIPENLNHPPAPAAIASAGLVCVLYAVTLGGTYVYDDVAVIQTDARVHLLRGWLEFFKAPYMLGTPDSLWRPLACLTYWLQWQLHGDVPWAFHLVNIALHAAVSAVVAILAWRLTHRSAVAWWAGLLFAAHPLHVEATAYLVGRAESLCALGVLGGLTLFAIRPCTPRRALAIVACFVVAALSKEHGLLLPPMLAVMYLARRWCVRPAAALAPAERCGLQWLFVGLAFGTLAYTLYRESIMHLYWDAWFLRWTINPIVRAHGLDRALLPLTILGHYAVILLLPLRPSPDYGAHVTGYLLRWNDPYLYAGAATVIAWCAAAVIAFRKRSAGVIVCLGCAAIAYALISNTFMMIGIVMGERLAYLTSAFVILLAAMALGRLPRRFAGAAMILLIGLASLRTATYAWRWNDALRLFSMSRAEHPEAVYLYVMEASTRLDRGDVDGAERVLAAARAIESESQNVWGASARAARLRGDTQAAAIYSERAFHFDNHPPQADIAPISPAKPRVK